jgi:hypothetical protein
LKKIKYIVVCGTSFTHGGGYSELSPMIEVLERHEGPIPKTIEECSWPAFFQKLIDPVIKVYNLALSGSSLEYQSRIINEWISNNRNKVKDTLFLLEISGYGRMELWDNEVEKYIVCNYGFNDRKSVISIHSGIYDREPKANTEKMMSGEELVGSFFNRYIEPSYFVEKIQSNFFDFLCKLHYKNIDFKIFGDAFWDPELNKDTLISTNRLRLYDSRKKETEGILDFLEKEKLQIKHATKGEYPDFHASLSGNKEIANQFYQQIKSNYLL